MWYKGDKDQCDNGEKLGSDHFVVGGFEFEVSNFKRRKRVKLGRKLNESAFIVFREML
jgi:hypothetical protein